MVAVTVVAAVRDPGPALSPFLRAIDAQTLPAADWALVVADASRDGSRERLQRFADSRPNVVLVRSGTDRDPAGRLAEALAAADGEHLLLLDQMQRLAPRALEALLARARDAGTGAVLGRVLRPGDSGAAAIPDDADRAGAGVDAARCLVLVRRDLLPGDADAAARAMLDPAGVAAGAAAVGRYACASEGAPSSAAAGARLDGPVAGWADGRLTVTVEALVPSPISAAWLLAAKDGAELAVPATLERRADGSATAVTAVLDPRDADAGRSLDDGLWDLAIRLRTGSGESAIPLPPVRARSAIVDGRPYVLRAVDGAVRVDAGATRSSVIGPMPKRVTAITESVRGALLTVAPLDLHAHGDGVLPARVLLDGFSLPARITCSDGEARLEAYLGSLAGTSRVAVVAGGGSPVQTGLRLRVGGTGRMTLEPAPPPAPPARRPSAVQRLRRALPAPLEPVALRLVRVPAVRGAYRRLIGR